jgi:serine/threonine protein kinase
MQFSLKDIMFDPPMEDQMKTAPRGSYGLVLFGYWKAENVPVAVKVLPARGPSGEQVISIMAWLAEAEVMRRLRESKGPGKLPNNVVLLFGIGAQEDAMGVSKYLVVMEKLKMSLRQALDMYKHKKKKPSLDVALQWTAKGIGECHDCNVVHSDIKAANVLLSATLEAKLGDLGTGRVMRAAASTLSMGGTATSTGARGSPLWLAPEMVEDSDLAPNPASDVYSWSIMAWEILTCRLPYHDEDDNILVNVDKLKSRIDP